MYDRLTPEKFRELKSIKLAGSIGLTHKPVLPSIIEFSTRKDGWLDDLRKLRETMAFKPGPSKRRLASSESESEVEGASLDENGNPTPLLSNTKTSKKGQSTSTVARKLANSKLDSKEQAMLLELFGTPTRRSKKNGT